MRVRSGTSAVPFYQWGTSTAWGWLNTSTGLESLRPWHLLGGLVSRYKRSGETAFSVTVQTFPGFTLTTSTNFKGAWVEGEAGTVTAKPTKVAKYIKAGVGNHWQGKSVPKGTSGGWRWFRLHSHVQKTIAIFFEPDLEDNC